MNETRTAMKECIPSSDSLVWNKRPDFLRDTVVCCVSQALLNEVILTPKPGLVDKRNCGAHDDMNLELFVRSTEAIIGWMPNFYDMGWFSADIDAERILQMLRPIGFACEEAMFSATKGVNTHKGAIFAFGLLCAAAGRLHALRQPVDQNSLCGVVARFCCNLVQRELVNNTEPRSKGERLFKQYGLSGARGEAESGFLTVRAHALPTYLRLLKENVPSDVALLQTLLHLYARNDDTNLVGRGGMNGLGFVQQHAQYLLWGGGAVSVPGRQALYAFDDELIRRHLSPGGSADLLAVTLFLSHFPSGNPSADVI
ncbi:triphosphoribosyl-dephospho-CoA synthase CitG [Pectobacteriaceae bacterium CE70]|nr:triphosphoribosyl-dephospho-CoA synthase CitG [Pectobacteriaceae bacterium C52]WJV66297.1 triphosphoribosyl-dephospho-CoA synthase CitG [Pectobacteriaceae bacterium CE70]WJY10304.1 triphosphoribosyl-dephospho-CoA synthase CitG [Pectobacteriaceae bacterium C80]